MSKKYVIQSAKDGTFLVDLSVRTGVWTDWMHKAKVFKSKAEAVYHLNELPKAFTLAAILELRT